MEKNNNKIPEDWEVVELDNIIKYVKGKKPTIAKETYENGYAPYLSTEYLRYNIKTSFAKVDEHVILVNKGELILLWDGSNAGEFFIGKDGILSSTMVKLIPKEKIDTKYLFYCLKSKERNLSGQTKGTGIPHVDKNVLDKIKIPIPPLPEQRAIARVLSTVDEAIQKADEAIERTERLKKGVMRDLFKDMELVPLVNYCEEKNDIVAGPFGSNLKVTDYIDVGVPIIRLQNIERNKFIEKDTKYISKEKANELKYHFYKPGDLVLAKLGDPIGKTCIIPNSMPEGIVVADVVRIRVSKSKAIPIFVEYALNSNSCMNQLKKETIGSTRPRVNITQIRNLKVPHFELPQQEKIAFILSTVDKKIELERERKAKFERVKKGLMNDLLTGRKRIKKEELKW